MPRDRQGRFLGIPYDWRRPNAGRAQQQKWDPEDRAILKPKSFGWGYTINFGALWRRLSGR
jgi:uncharacterized membrane protein